MELQGLFSGMVCFIVHPEVVEDPELEDRKAGRVLKNPDFPMACDTPEMFTHDELKELFPHHVVSVLFHSECDFVFGKGLQYTREESPAVYHGAFMDIKAFPHSWYTMQDVEKCFEDECKPFVKTVDVLPPLLPHEFSEEGKKKFWTTCVRRDGKWAVLSFPEVDYSRLEHWKGDANALDQKITDQVAEMVPDHAFLVTVWGVHNEQDDAWVTRVSHLGSCTTDTFLIGPEHVREEMIAAVDSEIGALLA